jgi:transposase-like protein
MLCDRADRWLIGSRDTMKAQDFRTLVEQLGDLSPVQRDALVEALMAKGSGDQVVAMIETRFAAAPSCGHCGAADFKPWGSASGLKRYMCRACERTFNALTGTPLAGLRLREKWLDYARSLVDGVSLRKAAARTDIHLETSFRWRHRFLAAARNKKASAVTGIVEADETFILKSAKGSRKLVGRSPRKRGGKASKPGLSTDEHDAILIVRDRHGETTDAILFDLSTETIGSHLKPVVAKDAVLVTDGNRAYQAFAAATDIVQIALVASAGQRTIGCYHIQNVNAYQSRFKLWMARFKGVASRYLPSSLGWRRMIERDGEALTPRHCLAGAMG